MPFVPAPVARNDPARRRGRRVLDAVEETWRYRTAGSRALPDYVIIGAQRSGTSSLARWLRGHPDVLPNFTGREVHYLDWHHDQGERWYRLHFPRRDELARRAGQVGARVLTGEKTPDYLVHPRAPEYLAEIRPDARVVVMVREPLDRAWSQYRKNQRAGLEHRSFDEALETETDRTAEGFARLADGEVLDRRHPTWLYSYAARGDYAAQLERWYGWFPRRQVHIARAEDLYEEPDAVYRSTLRFLGLREEMGPGPGPGGGPWASAAPTPDELRERHGDRFVDANRRLEALTGLSW